MNPETHAVVLDLRSRCIQADALRREGKFEEAEAMEPTIEEIAKGLSALRNDREFRTAKKKAKSEAKQSIPMNLNDLFNKESS